MKIANRIVANAMAANAAVDDEEVAEEKFGNAADKFIKGLKSVDAGLKECAKVSGQMANLLDLTLERCLYDLGLGLRDDLLDLRKRAA